MNTSPSFATEPVDLAALTGVPWDRSTARQQPTWPDETELARVLATLRSVPPLVFAGETDSLRERIAAAARGEAFILQGGDCAETFKDASDATRLRRKIQTLLQMAAVLTYGASMPVVKIGRLAGQFAKPRSSDVETVDGVTMPSYRGDMVNSHRFEEAARRHDPHRLLQAYNVSAATLNLLRAFTQGGYADLREVRTWNRGFTRNPAYARYETLAGEIDKAIRFMEACGADFDALKAVDLYSSHEALVLDYEDALARIDSRTGDRYGCSGHFLWIGERTRQPDGAHVKFAAQLRNPIGVKLGPTATREDVHGLVEALNPEREEGRLTFISRMGAGRIRDVLPGLVEAARETGGPVAWVTDPMHGNTITSATGLKTRRFDDVLDEVTGFFEVHRQLGTVPAGLHMEMTGDDVTEVLGGAEDIDDAGLQERYETLVDPRLNHQQSLEIAFLVASMVDAGHGD